MLQLDQTVAVGCKLPQPGAARTGQAGVSASPSDNQRVRLAVGGLGVDGQSGRDRLGFV